MTTSTQQNTNINIPAFFAFQKETQGDTFRIITLKHTLTEDDFADKTRHLEIYGDVITIPDETFSLPGRNVTIHARQIICNDGAIDVSGGEPEKNFEEGNLPNPEGGPDSLNGTSFDKISKKGDDGQKGVNGAAGSHGENGGDITLVADVLSGQGLTLIANGGNGGRGQDGGRGGNGGNGGNGDDAKIKEPDFGFQNSLTSQGQPGGDGGDGGNGGNGGNGGAGGKKGSIRVFYVKKESNPTFTMTAKNGEDGGAGAAGQPGKGGAGGKGGRIAKQGSDRNEALTTANLWRMTEDRAANGDPGTPGTKGEAGTVTSISGTAYKSREWPIQRGHLITSRADVLPRPKPSQSTSPGGIVIEGPFIIDTDITLVSGYQETAAKASFPAASLEQRLLTLHQAKLTYLAEDYDTTQSLLEWLRDVTPAPNIYIPIQGGIGRRAEWEQLHRRVQALLAQLSQGLDYYGHPRNHVPLVALKYYQNQLSNMLSLGHDIEQTYKEYEAAASNQKAAREKLEEAEEKATTFVEQLKQGIDDAIQQRIELFKAIEALEGDLETLEPKIDKARKAFEKAVKKEQERQLIKDLLMALPAIILTGVSAYGAIRNITGLLRTNPVKVSGPIIGGQRAGQKWTAAKPNTGTTQIVDETSYLEHIETAGQAVVSLTNQITGMTQKNSGSNPDTAKLITQKEEFDKALAPYLQLPETEIYQEQVHEYIDTIQSRNQKILEFDRLIVQQAELEAMVGQKEAEIGRIGQAVAKNHDPTLAPYRTFMYSLYSDVKEQLLKYLYQENAAYEFWALAENPFAVADNTIAELSKFHIDIQGQIIDKMNDTEEVRNPFGFSKILLKAEERPEQFAEFRRTGRITFSIDLANNPDVTNNYLGMAQMLATHFTVSIPGASSDSDLLVVRLIHNGTVTVLDQDWQIHTYTHDMRISDYRYDYKADTVFAGGNLGGTADDDYIGLSPFTTWTIEVSPAYNPGLNLEQVTEITFAFKGEYLPANHVSEIAPKTAPVYVPDQWGYPLPASGLWPSGSRVHYAVSFFRGNDESEIGPWSEWIKVNDEACPLINNIPTDPTVARRGRRVYRQFEGDDVFEMVGELDQAATAFRESLRHTVQAEETLESIGQLYGVSPMAMAAVNNIALVRAISQEQTLIIPPVRERWIRHTPQPGENIPTIAAQYGVTAQAISKTNNIIDSYPNPSQTIIIPAWSGIARHRVSAGLQVLYTFEEGSGTIVQDRSGRDNPLDLTLADGANATWVNGGIALKSGACVSNGSAGQFDLVRAVQTTNEITLEAWVKSTGQAQAGLAQLITVSDGPENKNFMLGQSQGTYLAHLRTTDTNSNGSNQPLAITSPSQQAEASLLHLMMTHSYNASTNTGEAIFYLNGKALGRRKISGNFSNWSPNFVLTLGDNTPDPIGNTGSGEFHLAAIYHRALTPAEVIQNYEVGPNPNLTPVVDTGPDRVVHLQVESNVEHMVEVALNGRVIDDRPQTSDFTVNWLQISGPEGGVTINPANSTQTTASFTQPGVYVLRLTAYDVDPVAGHTLQASDEVTINVRPNYQPYVKVIGPKIINLPNVVNLESVVTDDGLPNPPGKLTFEWTQVSGPKKWSELDEPHTVTFGTPNLDCTQATFSKRGLYTVRLTANDGHLEGSDELDIIVNKEPVIADILLNGVSIYNNGLEPIITLERNDKDLLDGALEVVMGDHGLGDPNSGIIVSKWTQISGDGTMTPADNGLKTSVNFSDSGRYLLELTAVQKYDEVEYLKTSVPVKFLINQAPVVDAGEDAAITLLDFATLNGTVSDDEFPGSSEAVSVRWTKESGPGDVKFTGDNTTQTTACFSKSGEYVLRLTANDGEASAYDQVTITVNATPRVTDDLQLLYTFDQNNGVTLKNRWHFNTPLELTIEDESAVEWIESGGLVIKKSTIVEGDDATELVRAIKATNKITIEAWVKPAKTNQDGPARIVTLSLNPVRRNFTLGQHLQKGKPSYNVRLRTTRTNKNGSNVTLSSPNGSLTTDLTHVVYTRDSSGQARIYLNGAEVANKIIDGDLSGWDKSYKLALANEITKNRTWLGELYLVAVYSRALSSTEVQQNYEVGIKVT